MKISTLITAAILFFSFFISEEVFATATYTIKVINGGMQNAFSQSPPPPNEKGSFFARFKIYPYGHSKGFCSPIACSTKGAENPTYTTVKPLAYGQSETLTVNMTKGPSFDPKTMILFNVSLALYTSKESNGFYYYSSWRTFTQNGLPKKVSMNTSGPIFSPSAASLHVEMQEICNSRASWQACEKGM